MLGLVVAVIITVVGFAEGPCEKCIPGFTSCTPGFSGGGTCQWSGGAICTGTGSCPIGGGTTAEYRDAECMKFQPPTSNCTLRKNADILASRCTVTCRVVPFISCDCIKTGISNGVGYIFKGTDCP